MMNWKMLKVCLIILGVLSLIFAVAITGADTGYYEFSETYGGDAYTGIQNAAAQTANNVQSVGDMIQTAVSYLLTVQGIGFIMFGLCVRTKNKSVPAPVLTESAVVPAE